MECSREITNAVINCEKVSKNFLTQNTELEVIKDISIRVQKNEFVVILGPGQCGKTTLVNLIAGLDLPSKGEIRVNGKKVIGPDPDRGVVYQKTALFPWFTVMGNVEFGPRMRGISKKERKEKAQYYIDLVGLTDFEKTYPIKLSGGMRQRVGIARAYCNDPSVMLMDEPFGHLDAQTRYLMQEELERIWSKEKRTVVFVTNNIEEAIYLADRIVVLSNCPSIIGEEFTVDLPRPRSYVSSDFLALRRRITSVMEKAK
jgi:ABC-type nitrate/sulfonate/bicarbonate transport system ATPase subunit